MDKLSLSKTKEFLKIKEQLFKHFSCLMASFEVYSGDGICVSDIEFAIKEFNRELARLEILCLSTETKLETLRTICEDECNANIDEVTDSWSDERLINELQSRVLR